MRSQHEKTLKCNLGYFSKDLKTYFNFKKYQYSIELKDKSKYFDPIYKQRK